MQFILVTFVEERHVFIDGGDNGVTGDVLTIEEGPHLVTLGSPVDYTPKQQTVDPFGTTVDNPQKVPFEKMAAPKAQGRQRTGPARGAKRGAQRQNGNAQ